MDAKTTNEGETQYTPGPWKLARGYFNVEPVPGSIGTITGAEWIVCTMEGDVPDNDPPDAIDIRYQEMQEANAKLIASAPDLFAALQNMLGSFDTPVRRRMFPSDFADEAIETARAALAKASS